jgi:hypothetical protein
MTSRLRGSRLAFGHLPANEIHVHLQDFGDVGGGHFQSRQFRDGAQLFLRTPLPFLFDSFLNAFLPVQ